MLYLTLILSRKGWIWQIISLFLVLGIFTLPLIYRWQTGFYHINIFGGLLPWSDSLDYYIDAQQLLMGQRFTQTSTKRPLFTGLLSVLLAVTGRNLQLTLVLLLLLNALSFYLFAREIQRSYGSLAAAFSLVFLYLFAQRFSGLTMTENLGMCLGALGLTNVLRGAREKKASLVLVGLFTIAVSLVTRSGAYFFLPAVVLWGAFYFRKTRKRLEGKTKLPSRITRSHFTALFPVTKDGCRFIRITREFTNRKSGESPFKKSKITQSCF
jgi:hypothetical protein